MTVTGSREALKPVTPLENVLRVMKSARRNDELMAVWSDDVKAVEDAIAALSPDPAGVTLTVEEIARIIDPSGFEPGNLAHEPFYIDLWKRRALEKASAMLHDQAGTAIQIVASAIRAARLKPDQ